MKRKPAAKPKTPTHNMSIHDFPPPAELCTDPDPTPEEAAEAEANAIDLEESGLGDILRAGGSVEVN